MIHSKECLKRDEKRGSDCTLGVGGLGKEEDVELEGAAAMNCVVYG